MRAMLTFAVGMLSILGGTHGVLAAERVAVAGATGRTGQLVVQELRSAGYEVRALVRNRAKAVTPADGVQVVEADVRKPETLEAALSGTNALIIATGAGRGDPANGPEQVDYEGVRNLAQAAADAKLRQVVLVSSAGVTHEDHILNKKFNNVLLWKFKGEEALRASGVPYTIVRPGGLTNQPGGKSALTFDQGDDGTGMVARSDVARVCVAALAIPAARNRSFELFSAPGPASADLDTRFAALKPDGPDPDAPADVSAPTN